MVHWTHIIPHLSVSPRPCFHALKQSLGCFFHLTAAGYPSEYSMWSHESPYCWWFRNPVNSPVEGTVVLSHYFPRFYICIQPVVFTPNFWTIQQWTPQSWKQKKSNHTRVSPNPAGRPPQFSASFSGQPLTPPRGKTNHPEASPKYLSSLATSEVMNLYLHPTEVTWRKKTLGTPLTGGCFFCEENYVLFIHSRTYV